MSARTRRRISFEARAQQDDRLTGQHIRTLLHMQDLHSENDRLRLRVAELELQLAQAKKYCVLEEQVDRLTKELLQCETLHELGRECKQRLQQMEQNCLKRLDENTAFLTTKHKDELMKIVSEKLESENTWLQEKQKLLEEIESLKKTIGSLEIQLRSLEATVAENSNLSSMLAEAQDRIQSLEGSNVQLKKEREDMAKGLGKKAVENSSLRAELEKLKMRMDILQVQIKMSEKTAAENVAEQHEVETERLQLQISSLRGENIEISKKNKELQILKEENEQTISVLEFNLRDSTKTLKLLYKERELLKNRITCLLNEKAAQKVETPESSTRFSDCVELRRDYISLKEEHDRLLMKKNSKPKILPSLKADLTTVKRTIGSGISTSSDSTKSLKGSARVPANELV